MGIMIEDNTNLTYDSESKKYFFKGKIHNYKISQQEKFVVFEVCMGGSFFCQDIIIQKCVISLWDKGENVGIFM